MKFSAYVCGISRAWAVYPFGFSYGSKKKGNLHQLKTDSAERKVPVYCLLKTDEYQIFHNHVVEQRLLNQENLYLFSNWNENSKLNKHTVTTPFRMIMNELFKTHDYSFHSFRHTAANHLSILLNCDYAPLVKNLTDYTAEEYQSIRTELLRNTHGQNHWFMIAHLLGHIDLRKPLKAIFIWATWSLDIKYCNITQT